MYEWVGAAAPCFLLLLSSRSHLERHTAKLPSRHLVIVAALTTATSVLLAICFARESAGSLAVARLQPLRSLHLVFLAFLAAAPWLQQRRESRFGKALPVAGLAITAVFLFAMQRSLYPNTAHLEWPWTQTTNQWQAAFAWCRNNTPANTLFALDSRYIDAPGEDTHGFRAVALRSAMPDAIKDAGIAAVLPALSPAWQTGVTATEHLNQNSDAERIRRLHPLGVTWLVLPAFASTALPCPYRNSAAKVCRLQ